MTYPVNHLCVGEGKEFYPCGHPKTLMNSQSVGTDNGQRCRMCRRDIARRYYHNKIGGKRQYNTRFNHARS